MYFDPEAGVVLVLLDVEENTPLKAIETDCQVTISPVSTAQVIVNNQVFNAVYGCLPCSCGVLAVKNGSGAFPDQDLELKIRAVLEPYQPNVAPFVKDATVRAWDGDCPICGRSEAEPVAIEVEADEDDPDWWNVGKDEDDDDDEEEDKGEPWRRRFVMPDEPSLN